MSWNDERVDLLSKMWLEGRSASQIATELGGGVTRNAVIGKVHRLGLSGRATKVAAPVTANDGTAETVVRLRPKPSGKVDDRAAAPLDDLVPATVAPVSSVLASRQGGGKDVVIPISDRVTIMDLRDTMCRWPIGDPTNPEFRYCGSRSGPLGPYCSEHARLAFQPTQDRRRVDRVARIA